MRVKVGVNDTNTISGVGRLRCCRGDRNEWVQSRVRKLRKVRLLVLANTVGSTYCSNTLCASSKSPVLALMSRRDRLAMRNMMTSPSWRVRKLQGSFLT